MTFPDEICISAILPVASGRKKLPATPGLISVGRVAVHIELASRRLLFPPETFLVPVSSLRPANGMRLTCGRSFRYGSGRLVQPLLGG
jgi:hypothetical protein